MSAHPENHPSTLRLRRPREDGSVLFLVLFAVALLAIATGTYMNALGTSRRLQEQRLMGDRALMAAEAGLALEVARIEASPTPPTADETRTVALPSAQYAPFQNISITTRVQTFQAQAYWTVGATATAAAGARGVRFSRRVQATLSQQNFARYELFIHDYGGVWSPGYVSFIGVGAVYMGPVHINSGTAFFPNFWAMSEVTSAAPGGVRLFPDWGSYLSGVYGNNAAHDYVNILNYWSSTFPNAPQFYGGLTMLDKPILLPTDMNVDVRAERLRTNAGLTLPAQYPGYAPASGPNFAIDLTNPTPSGEDGMITIKQVLSVVNGVATYGPPLVRSVSGVNGALIVKGNILSLKGTLNGRLTIGAFKDAANPDAGNVGITGNLEYESRKKLAGFEYTDAPAVYTSDGKGIDKDYIQTLQARLDNVNDILGIVAEGNVMIKEKDLANNTIMNNVNAPNYIDAVVMATGSSTSTPSGGGFGVEGDLTRTPGKVYFLGGMIENKALNWALFTDTGVINGIDSAQLWDQRASKAGGAPPFFPSTGNYQVVPNSWNSSYVESGSTPVVLPDLAALQSPR